MSIDYRLLHHFRVSQRREMAARGALPEQWRWEEEPAEENVKQFGRGEEMPLEVPKASLVQLLTDDR